MESDNGHLSNGILIGEVVWQLLTESVKNDGMASKAQATKWKINKWDLIRLEKPLHTQQKKPSTEWKKIYVTGKKILPNYMW